MILCSRQFRIFLPLFIFAIFFAASPASAATLQKPPNNLGLVTYFPMSEGSGTQVGDFSGRGNMGTLVNGPTWTTGKLGNGLNFDGVDDHVRVTSLDNANFPQSGTLSFWIKADLASQTTKGVFDNYGAINHVFIRTCAANACSGVPTQGLQVAFQNPSTYVFGRVFTVQNNEWAHVVVVWDTVNDMGYVYLNGILISSGSGPITDSAWVPNQERAYIGGLGANYFNGKLDEVRIYNRAISATEVTNLYQSSAVKINSSHNNEVTNGLVGLWSFDGPDMNGTTAYDRSGQGNNGILTNGPTRTIGKLGQGMGFDGVNDYVNIPNSSNINPGTGNFTISAWVKIDSPLNDYQRIISKGLGSIYYAFVKFPGDKWKFEFRDGTLSTADVDFGSGTISYGKWMYLVVTVSAGDALTSGYLDGVLKDTSSTTSYGSVTNTDYLSVGRGSIGASYSLDDVRVYNRTLTQSEVTQLYSMGGSKINSSQNTIPGSTLQTGLVGLWSFNGPDMSGTIAYDRSGQGNNGTLTNGPAPTIGKVGQGMKFDGVNDYMDVSVSASLDTNFFSSSNWAISMWVKPNLTGDATQELFMGVWHRPRIFLTAPAGNLTFAGFASTAYTNFISKPSFLTADTWTHLSVVSNGVNYTLYKDGVQSATVAYSQIDATATPFRFGADGSGTDNFSGTLDEARIYNRALSAAEVKQLYQVGR